MPGERVQRQIDRLLDDAEVAIGAGDWARAADLTRRALTLDPDSSDARDLLGVADRGLGTDAASSGEIPDEAPAAAPHATREEPAATPAPPPLPTAFAAGRYTVQRFLGEGGAKQVYLAHDTLLDRPVAIALLRAEGLDGPSRTRLRREAQALGRLGSHPHIVSVFDLGETEAVQPGAPGQPFLVTEYLPGGDLAAHLAATPDHRLPLTQCLTLAAQVCRALAAAHARGIIHRDLKPGNIWLAADGAAKVGDFGLAVALDRARLTQAGMLVGTVAYLPPEQALGGEVSGQADLYSLGCLLYELVTGRPPFLADDPTAVITQHLSTPPVAPSWLAPSCPPALDDLILHLLAKDPAQRPAGAEAVLAALSHIDPTERPHPPRAGGDAGASLARLARGVFVGRDREVGQLRQAFDHAYAGRGGLVLLVGEPGIGKTRAAQELETYARLRQATVLWGACPEGGGAPAYWPWLQVGRAWGSRHDPARLRAALGSLAGELVRLFPELKQTAGYPAPEPISDPASAQYRLFDAYVSFLTEAAAETPLVVVLDDLHWADKPTLLLLQHLARELAQLRVLVVGTYRDTDLVRTHPLSEVLAGLGRGGGFTRIVLRGLSPEETAAYIRGTARVEVSAALLAKLGEETEGNPFFLSEVVNLLVQEGTLGAERVSDIRVPDGVREALGRRLDRLSAETNALLQTAAVIGREFNYATLAALGTSDEETLLRHLDEAVQGRVVDELARPGRYRFSHALMQETLLAEITTTRKVRLHGQVGEALERRWGARADQQAATLARHFGEAAILSPRYSEKALRYAKLAAEQAEAATAWDEASRYYEQTLTLQTGAEDHRSTDRDGDEAALLVALGRCRALAGLFRLAWPSLERAISLYRERGDGVGLARAAWETRWVTHFDPVLRAQVLDEALSALGEADPHLAARLLAERALAVVPIYAGEAMAERAAKLARVHSLTDVHAKLTFWQSLASWFKGRSDEALVLARDAAAQFTALGQHADASNALHLAGGILQQLGHLDEALADHDQAFLFAQRAHFQRTEESVWLFRGQIAFLRGDFATMEDALGRMHVLPFYARISRAISALIRGDVMAATALLPSSEEAGEIAELRADVYAIRARVLLHAGDRASAALELRAWAALREQPGIWGERVGESRLEVLGESLVAVGDEALIRAVYQDVIKDLTKRWRFMESLDVFRGMLALRLDLVNEAETHFRTGLAWTERERLPIEAGRCLIGLAEVAERRGAPDEALALLDRAAAYFEPHGSLLYLRQIAERRPALQTLLAAPQPAAPVSLRPAAEGRAAPPAPLPAVSAERRLVTVLFTDIVGSTERAAALGDREWRRLKAQHHALVRQELARHGGHEVDTAGDGFFVTFDRPGPAIACARAITQAVRALDLEIRAGLHAGEVEWQAGGVSGLTVHTGARVAALSGAGEVLVTQTVRDLVAGAGLTFTDRGTHTLKGLPDPWRLFALDQSA